jgi:hypothetical protein
VNQLRVDTLPTAATQGTPAQLYLDSATSNYDAVRESFLCARANDAPSHAASVVKRRQTDNTSSTTGDKDYIYDDDEDAYEEVHSPPNSPISMIV